GATQEHLVRLDRVQQPLASRTRDLGRSGVGGSGIGKPNVALEHRQDLSGKETALGLQMTGPLAPEPSHIGQDRVEEHYRLRAHRAVLDAPETQRVNIAAGL